VRRLAIAALAVVCTACPRSAHSTFEEPQSGPVPPGQQVGLAATPGQPPVDPHPEIAEMMFDGGYVNGWQDWGWSPHEVDGGPARVRFDNWGGWMLAKPGLTGYYGGVVFRVKIPPGEAEFQQVWLESGTGATFPKVNISPDNHTVEGDGWSQVFVPMSQLNPDGVDFERFVFHVFRPVGPDWILIDKVALTKAKSGPPPAPTYDATKLPQMALSVDCRAKATKINPMVYGIAYYAPNDAEKQAAQWLLGATARRWGGNTMTTYNWQIDAWNAGRDWFYENLEIPSYREFLKENDAHGMASAVTVPMIGWVAKDKTSSSFPVSVFGPQESTDQYRPDAGNGKDKSGKNELPPGPPTRAYMAVTPDFVKKWVQAIRQEDQKTGKRSVSMYILDNEPSLWWTNHRDAHPTPLSYDELVQRTIDYGTAIREADPEAVIAGPAEWGWTNYMYSPKDQAAGMLEVLHPDRRAHENLPLVAYYLKALAEHQKKTGVRVLDVFDLHTYPYNDGVYGNAVDPHIAEIRVRSTRMLWDPTYVDGSWIKEPIRLLPRMREWVDQYDPGVGISIGEWNFGGEGHMSGALAIADVLGRFGQFGVTSGFYWTYPPENSPAMWAFRAYRNFDGKGGRFLDWSEPTKAVPEISLFASRDDSGAHLVAIVLNQSRKDAVNAQIDLASCGKVDATQGYTYTGSSHGFVAAPAGAPTATKLSQVLPPYSITILDLHLTDASPLAK
jgi:Glycoside hydrolase family 44